MEFARIPSSVSNMGNSGEFHYGTLFATREIATTEIEWSNHFAASNYIHHRAKAFCKEQELMKKSDGKKNQVLERAIADFRDWDTDNTKYEVALEQLISALGTDESRESPPPPRLGSS